MSLMRNLLVRDLILDALKVNNDERLKLFISTEEYVDKKDAEILQRRKNES